MKLWLGWNRRIHHSESMDRRIRHCESTLRWNRRICHCESTARMEHNKVSSVIVIPHHVIC